MFRMIMMAIALAVASPAVAEASASATFPIAAAPADPIAYRNLTLDAKSAFDAGDYPKAEQLYRQAVTLYPVDWTSWRYLGHALRFQDKHRESIDAYEQLIRLRGTFYGTPRYWQAVAYTKLGDRKGALATLRKMVFEDHAIDRPALIYDENFKPLWDDPEFRALIAPAAPRNIDRAAGWRGDLAHLVAEIHRLSPEHRGRPLPATTQALVDRLNRDIPSLSDVQIYARLAEVVGSLKMNHTQFWGAPPPGTPGPKALVATTFLPLELYEFRDGIYVVGATPEHRSLIGSRVESIGNTAIDEVMRGIERTMSYRSSAELAWTAPDQITTVPLLQGLGYTPEGRPVSLGLRKAGRKFTVSLDPVAEQVGHKLPAPPAVAAPMFLQDIENPHWFRKLPDGRTVYAQFNQVADAESETLADFGRKLRATLTDPAIDSVIVDVRHNNGGNTFLYTELARTLVAFSARPNAQLYVLIGRNVYSAAGNFVTDLERFANPVFVGEPTGDMGNQEGDEGKVILPYSGLSATIAAVKWQLSDPWDNRGTIVPQVPVELTAADYFAGRDPVLDTVMKLVASSRH